MLKKLKETNPIIFFLLALLLHLSFLIGLSVSFRPIKLNYDLKPLPAYVYREEKYNPQTNPHLPVQAKEQKKQVSKLGIEKPSPEKTQTEQATTDSLSMGNGLQNVNLNLKSKNNMDKPLLNLITKAVAAHLKYPKIAMDFHLTGRSLVGFIIYPDGHLSDITLVQSSGDEVLDQAAMAAINAISPLKNAKFYLTKPEPLVMGIIFQ